MSVWITAILSLTGFTLIAFSVLLLIRWSRVNADVRALSKQAGVSDDQSREALAGAQAMLLTVEILNPLELARSQSRIGASLAGIAPGLVRKKVYQTVARELGEELAERGVQANIELRQADAP